MAERRSLGDAMEMTPEKLAFIKGQSIAKELLTKAKESSSKKGAEKIIELESQRPTIEPAIEPKSKTVRHTNRPRSNQGAPEVSELLDQVLVPITIRLPHRAAQALRRAHLELRLKHAKPDTQQEIVGEAINDWLSKKGFLV